MIVVHIDRSQDLTAITRKFLANQFPDLIYRTPRSPLEAKSYHHDEGVKATAYIFGGCSGFADKDLSYMPGWEVAQMLKKDLTTTAPFIYFGATHMPPAYHHLFNARLIKDADNFPRLIKEITLAKTNTDLHAQPPH